MKKNQIFRIYGKEYKEMTKRLLEAADLAALLPEKDKKIGIKPNLVSPSPAMYGGTTHPEVVAGIIEYLQERGYYNLMIAEGSWVGDRTSDSMEVCGYDRLARKYGVALRDAQKDSGRERDCGGMKLKVCSCVDEMDFLINVPVLKGHCQTKITCALKNMKGLIPNQEKRHFHAMGLHRPIAHLNAGIHQDFIVVDHICGDLDFEDGGNPVVCDCVMAARDPVLVDACVCRLLHYAVDEVPYIRMAEKLGVGCADLTQAELFECADRNEQSSELPEYTDRNVQPSELPEYADRNASSSELPEYVGSKVVSEKDNWILKRCDIRDMDEELPLKRKIVELRDAVEEVESCSACYGYLIPALERLREEGLLSQLDTKICIGQGYQKKSGTLGIGRCTSDFTYHVKGCPPTEEQIYEFLKAFIQGAACDSRHVR